MTSFKRIALGGLLALVLAFTACIKSEQVFTIYPDGSGKVEVKQTISGMMAQMMKGGGPGGPQGGGQQPDLADMVKKSMGGKVYWTDVSTSDGPNGEIVLSGTGYFEHVNDLKPEKGTIAFEASPDGGYVFTMTQEIPDEMKGGMPGMGGEGGKLTPEQEAQRQQAMQMMKAMMAGFEMKLAVVMPGEIKSADGLPATEGRKASLRIGEEDLQAFMEQKKQPPTQMKVVSGPASVGDEELSAFKKELESARAAAGKSGAPPAGGGAGGQPKGNF